jgi:hypothetical protein
MGFSIVPHSWLPEKVFMDCLNCSLFQTCHQYAMVVPLDSMTDGVRGPLAAATASLA